MDYTPILVVGVGSGGSQIAKWLATSGGVAELHLIDRDELEVENLSRHICGVESVGRSKVQAVADCLETQVPHSHVFAHHFDVLEDPERLADIMRGVHLVICGTDSQISRRLISRLALMQHKTVIFPRCYTRASGGDVFIQNGEIEDAPCLDCWISRLQVQERAPGHEDRPGYADSLVESMPGLALDIAPVAQRTARLALDFTAGKKLENGLWVWAARPEGNAKSWRVADASPAGLTTDRWYRVQIARESMCPACGQQAFIDSLSVQAHEYA